MSEFKVQQNVDGRWMDMMRTSDRRRAEAAVKQLIEMGIGRRNTRIFVVASEPARDGLAVEVPLVGGPADGKTLTFARGETVPPAWRVHVARPVELERGAVPDRSVTDITVAVYELQHSYNGGRDRNLRFVYVQPSRRKVDVTSLTEKLAKHSNSLARPRSQPWQTDDLKIAVQFNREELDVLLLAIEVALSCESFEDVDEAYSSFDEDLREKLDDMIE